MTGEGLDHLLELLLLQAEILEIKANPKMRGRAVVIESHLDKGRGPVATVIIERGELKIGDPLSLETISGKSGLLQTIRGAISPKPHSPCRLKSSGYQMSQNPAIE